MPEPRRRGRPTLDPAIKAKSFAVKLPPADQEMIRARADELGISQARLIVEAVKAYQPDRG